MHFLFVYVEKVETRVRGVVLPKREAQGVGGGGSNESIELVCHESSSILNYDILKY